MKTTALFLFASLLLSSCGEDAASKKLAADTEARVTASIQQLLVQAGDKAGATSYVQVVHNWYQSEVPNLVKLNPKTESIFQAHAAMLQEKARNLPVFSKHPMVQPTEAVEIAGVYERALTKSKERITSLTQLAQKKTSLSEAEQLRYVSELADGQQQALGRLQSYADRQTATLVQRVQKENTRKYNQRMWNPH